VTAAPTENGGQDSGNSGDEDYRKLNNRRFETQVDVEIEHFHSLILFRVDIGG
jgi:hypothetical protein